MKFTKTDTPIFLRENAEIIDKLRNLGVSSFILLDDLDIHNCWFVHSVLTGTVKVQNASVKYALLNGRAYFTWKSGTWIDGTFKGDLWQTGTWKKGTWEIGNWNGGTWEYGTWEYGLWRAGTWEDGTWENGTFREDKGKSIWIKGIWEKGNFRDGTWKGGTWEHGTWIGGTWEGGNWLGGEWDATSGWIRGQINGIDSNVSPNSRSFRDKSDELVVGAYSHKIKELNDVHNKNVYYVVDFLSKFHKIDDFIDLQTIRRHERNNNRFKVNLERIIGKNSKGFTIQDILDRDIHPAHPEELTNITQLKLHKNLELNLSQWSGAQNIFYKNNQNYVLQLNYTGDYGDISNRPNAIHNAIKISIDPIDRKSLTISWCRFTIFKDKENKENSYVVLDEIQSLYEKKDPFLKPGFIDGWAEFTMKRFINYVRVTLGIRKIKMPTYETKIKKYGSRPSPPVYLYSDIPRDFGFKKDTTDPEFLVLEDIY